MKSYSIYQIKDEHPVGRYIKFMPLEFAKEENLGTETGYLYKLDSDMYEKVYDGKAGDYESDIDCLNDLYSEFQGKKPEGYTGHSLSVSDVIVLDGKAYYVDSYGFEEIDF